MSNKLKVRCPQCSTLVTTSILNVEALCQECTLVWAWSDSDVVPCTKKKEIEGLLLCIYMNMGMDRPANHSEILDFVYDDVDDVAWTDGDVAIAFRRFVENRSVRPPLYDTYKKCILELVNYTLEHEAEDYAEQMEIGDIEPEDHIYYYADFLNAMIKQ